MADRALPSIRIVPTDHDIILGRGAHHAHLAGSGKMYAMIEGSMAAYRVSSKSEKTLLIGTIYDSLQRQGCRFVRFDRALGRYFVAAAQAAKIKLGHCMRYQIRLVIQKSQAESTGQEEEGEEEEDDDEDDDDPPELLHNNGNRPPSPGTVVSLFSEQELQCALGRPGEVELPHRPPDFDSMEFSDTSY